MMNERVDRVKMLRVSKYDGQAIYVNNEVLYELGGYLGGGVAGVVYEAVDGKSKQRVAIKILNPIGYKLMATSALSRCIVVIKGSPRSNNDHMLTEEHVWWMVNPSTKQVIAAFEDLDSGGIKELTLPKCLDVWGFNIDEKDALESKEVCVQGMTFRIPKVPKKFVKFAVNRNSIFREVAHMTGLERHENVVHLEEALELIQDSKSTFFLVLELAVGGELFDRIKLNQGTDEESAHNYFTQLLAGVAFCHNCGICHRDLKPENLLLAANDDNPTLKIADFGLSAIFTNDPLHLDNNESMGNNRDTPPSSGRIKRLRSIVGSPHYVAPEVLQCEGHGYDGAKADAWSVGIILYAMLAGNLPFGKDLLQCNRYSRFCKWWMDRENRIGSSENIAAYPQWLFSMKASNSVKCLIVHLLHPNPTLRLSVHDAEYNHWVLHGSTLGEKLVSSKQFALTDSNKVPPGYSSNMPQVEVPFETLHSVLIDQNDLDHKDSNSIKTNCAMAIEIPRTPKNVNSNEYSTHNMESLRRKSYQDPHQKLRVDSELFGSSPPLYSRNGSVDYELNFLGLHLSIDSSDHTLERAATWCEQNAANSRMKLCDSPPSYHEFVKRSTKFTTEIAAAVILTHAKQIIENGEMLLLYPDSRVKQHVDIDWTSFTLKVCQNGTPACSIQAYLLRTGLNLIEFQRGQVSIFQFKRFYDVVRKQLAQSTSNKVNNSS